MASVSQEGSNTQGTTVKRRSFVLALFTLSGAAVAALLSVPLVRFTVFPLRERDTDTTWSDVGPIQQLSSITAPVSKTITFEHRDAWETTSHQTAVYVLPPKDGQFRVFSTVCPHLGCAVRWVGEDSEFLCPCHGGSFTAAGERIAGPPPRSMDSLETKVEDGILKVRYQYFRQMIPKKEVLA
ncbi:MAG TPA: ubiquinol-cytochrome c reductase iron-sulfur subunit [Acidobacteriaceae bacterium]|nr:ubiquinol-cytochrome c reductase iron-sulfur subunit [Acidobacteriaceae bacterium]